MRLAALSAILLLALMASVELCAQPPGQQQPAAASPPPVAIDPQVAEARLNQLLAGWEQNSARIQNLYAEFRCIQTRNNVNGMQRYFQGTAKFMRLPGDLYGARLEQLALDQNGKTIAGEYEKYVCTGTHIYTEVPKDKAIYFQVLSPKQANQPPDEGLMPFLFGMKAATARQRFDLKVTKIDDWYTYLDVRPRDAKAQADFAYARLVIMNKDAPTIPKDLPRELFWVETNKNEVKWDFKAIHRDTPNMVQRQDFMKPQVPKDWRLVPFDNNPPGQPAGNRIIRP